MKFRTRIFCMGKAGDDCEAGHLETVNPMETGDVFEIKGRKWEVKKVTTNYEGEPLANLVPFHWSSRM